MNTERFVVAPDSWDANRTLEIRSEHPVLDHENSLVWAAGSLGACVAAKRLFELPEQGTTSAEPYTADHER